MPIPDNIKKLAIERRHKRWTVENTKSKYDEVSQQLIMAIAKWQDAPMLAIKFSNVACHQAPADLPCVFIHSSNPMRNPCIFCGEPEESLP